MYFFRLIKLLLFSPFHLVNVTPLVDSHSIFSYFHSLMQIIRYNFHYHDMKVTHLLLPPKYPIRPLHPCQTLEYFHFPTSSTATPQMRPSECFPLFNPPPMPRFAEICLLFLVSDCFFRRVVKAVGDHFRKIIIFYIWRSQSHQTVRWSGFSGLSVSTCGQYTLTWVIFS